MTRDEAEIAIAKVIHAYDHPDYDTCTYCVFCLAEAQTVLNGLPPKELAP